VRFRKIPPQHTRQLEEGFISPRSSDISLLFLLLLLLLLLLSSSFLPFHYFFETLQCHSSINIVRSKTSVAPCCRAALDQRHAGVLERQRRFHHVQQLISDEMLFRSPNSKPELMLSASEAACCSLPSACRIPKTQSPPHSAGVSTSPQKALPETRASAV